jgi:hypothetical protein
VSANTHAPIVDARLDQRALAAGGLELEVRWPESSPLEVEQRNELSAVAQDVRGVGISVNHRASLELRLGDHRTEFLGSFTQRMVQVLVATEQLLRPIEQGRQAILRPRHEHGASDLRR